MSEHISRGYSKLNDAVLSAGLNPDSAGWLINALDPFHDVEIKIKGMPDSNTSKSVVFDVKKTVEINRPTTYSANNNWSFRIDMLPLYQPISMLGITKTSNVSAWRMPNSLPPAVNYYPIMITSRENGSSNEQSDPYALYPNQSNEATTAGTVSWDEPLGAGTSYHQINISSIPGFEDDDPIVNVLNDGKVRLLGAAFEVKQITPELYKGGLATCYRVDDLFTGDDKINIDVVRDPGGGDIAQVFYYTDTMTLPPADLAAMMQYKNTVQWEANRGCYVVAALHPESMTKYKSLLDKNHLFAGSDLPSRGDNGATNGLIDSQANLVNFAPLGIQDRSGDHVGNAITPCGAYFTSLHPNATFNLTVRYIYEKIPDYTSPLRTLATNYCPFDRRALDLYAEVASNLPVGVPQDENPFGEWFDSVMTIVKNVAPMIGKGVGALVGDVGIGTAIGNGIGSGAGFLGNWNKTSREANKGVVWF